VKTYKGTRSQNERGGFNVAVVETDDDGRVIQITALTHHRRHSPDGHSWGYHGSGPSELAKDILWDHTGEEPHPAVYQAFKVAYIASLPMDEGWELPATAVQEWLDAQVGSPVP
jgi:hypothetical protein